MKVIVITDDCQGMLFNNRRQSKDKMLRKEIINLCKNKILYMNEYSYNQFESSEKEEVMIRVSESFLRDVNMDAGKIIDDGYCLVENENLTDYVDDINEIVMFKWNTKYPADMYFDIDLNRFQLVVTKDFQGNSHNKITMEIYKR